MFLAFGAKRRAVELDKEGKPVERKYIDYKVVTDERIVDGFYYASVLKYFHKIARRPTVLDNPPEEVVQDID